MWLPRLYGARLRRSSHPISSPICVKHKTHHQTQGKAKIYDLIPGQQAVHCQSSLSEVPLRVLSGVHGANQLVDGDHFNLARVSLRATPSAKLFTLAYGCRASRNFPYSFTKRFLIAYRTRSASDSNPNFLKILALWLSTVFGLRSKRAAISLGALP